MIYTVTLNPAIDCVMHLDKFNAGCTNRASGAFCIAGGKGVNVSQVLKSLGKESILLGFLAGFTGREIERQLTEKGCRCDFIMLPEGFTRINIKLNGSEETEINGTGAPISESDRERLFEKLKKLGRGDILVLAGSIPKGLSADIYSDIMELLSGTGADIAVDTEGKALLNTLRHRPFLIKPNNHELGAIFGCEISTPEDAAKYGIILRQQGARNVLVSMAGDGAVLCAEDGKVYFQAAAKGRVINSVGAGDSMVAGFIAGFTEKRDYAYALKLGTAAGAATAFSEELAAKEDIEEILTGLGEPAVMNIDD